MKKIKVENQTKSSPARTTDSFLGKGTIMTGTLKFPGNLTYHGHFKGKIISDGKLIVGETGEVDSEISVAVALNSGEIRGSITASEKIQILPFGRIEGNVKTPDLQIESGAVFNGKSEMPDQPPEVLSAKPKEKRPEKIQEKPVTKRSKDTHTAPFSQRPQKAVKNRAIFPILSIAAVLLIFYGAGFIREHLLSTQVPDKIKSISDNNKIQITKEKNEIPKKDTPPNTIQNAEKQVSIQHKSSVIAKAAPERKAEKTTKTATLKKKPEKRRVTATETVKKKRVQFPKKKPAFKSPKAKETISNIPEIRETPPADVDTLKSLAALQLSKGKSKKAIDTFKKILEISPSDSGANLKLARLYFNSGYRELADIHFAKQEKLAPKSIETVINEGFRQLSRKNSQKALSIFKAALLEAPSNIRAKYGLATVYSKQNFRQKAIRICKSALKDSPGIVPFQNEIAWLNGTKKRPATGISLSRR